MKIVLSTLNSKFIHSSLSIRYLKEYVREIAKVEIKEYTINQNIDFIVSELYRLNPDVIGFSTYIWNVEEIIKVSKALKIVRPNMKIFLGGPEVSYDGMQSMRENPHIDFILYGEGEETFREFTEKLLEKSEEFSDVNGLIYKKGEEIIKNPPRALICELDKIPSPYEKISNEFKNKIVYLESSRGCPFGCKFCLSSTIRGVRYFSIERVKRDLDNLIDSGVRQVKFVDRTFNANKEYSMDIMNHIMDRDPKNMNFHFEVTAHLLDEEMLEFISHAKEGLFQFEIGVQSTNPLTIDAIGRTTDLERLKEVTKRIKSYKNIHQHLDLIAGLPYEDYSSFRDSFNDVFEIRPEKIQLGFLKLLKGSELRDDEDKYGFKYLNSPPYEVLKTDYINYMDVIKLKGVEDAVEKYYNEGYFEHTIEYIIANNYNNAFDFFEDLSEYWVSKKYHHVSNSRTKLYQILADFYKDRELKDFNIFRELIRFDFIANNRSSKMPEIIKNKNISTNYIDVHALLKDERVLNRYLSEYKNTPTKRIIKDVKVERFSVDVFKLIEDKYKYVEADSHADALFIYRKDSISGFSVFDIGYIAKELV